MSIEQGNPTTIENNFNNDPNLLAYQEALANGQFEELEPGTYVAFHEGEFVKSETDREKLAKWLMSNDMSDSLLQLVGAPMEVITITHEYKLISTRR